MSIHDYFDKSTQTIMAFQYLECFLKFYIRDCDEIIQEAVKDKFHYVVNEKEIEKMPLGKLIGEFLKRSDKQHWEKGLRQLCRIRNQFAHQAFLITTEDQNDDEKLKRLAIRADKIRKLVNQCSMDIYKESSRTTGNEIDLDLIKEWLK